MKSRIITLIVVSTLFGVIRAQPVSFDTWLEAEHADQMSGVSLSRYVEAVTECGEGDWLLFRQVNFMGGEYSELKVLAGKETGGTISVRIDSIAGPQIASIKVGTYGTVTYRTPLTSVSGEHDLYVVFSGAPNVGSLNRIVLAGSYEIKPQDARTYYVDAAAGSDEYDGLSTAKPFKTLRKASSVMKPGSTCLVRKGIYRETLRPVYTGMPGAPITFQAFQNENVFISAAEPLSGWVKHTGSIHKTKMPWSMGSTDRNMVFVDGVGMYLARTPNADGPCIRDEKYENDNDQPRTRCRLDWQDRIHPLLIPPLQVFSACDAYVSNNSPDTSFVACFGSYETAAPGLASAPADYLKGGIFLAYATRYWSTMGRITKSEPSTATKGKLTVSRYSGANMCSPLGKGAFVCDDYNLLDKQGEWYWDPADSMMYLWMPLSDDPSGHIVEGKRRMLVADLRSRSNVVLRNLRFLGGSMTMENANNCIVEGCHFREISHLYMIGHDDEIGAAGYGSRYDPSSGYKGIYVSGKNNVLRKSSFAVSAGSGLILDGRDQVVENCHIRDCNYIGTYDACIYIMNRNFSVIDTSDGYNSTGHQIIRNTLSGSSRELIHLCTTGKKSAQNPIVIKHNDFSYFVLNSYEGGAIYTYGNAGSNTDCSYNWFHSHGSFKSSAVCQDVGHRDPWRIHHNVVWASDALTARRIHAAFYVDSTKNIVYNNTIVDKTDWRTKDPTDTSTGYRWADGGANTLYAAGDTAFWKFTGASLGDHSLRSGSPAIDAGMIVSGYLESFKGRAPDLGAYEYGEPRWTAGADWIEPPWQYTASTLSAGSARKHDGLLDATVKLVGNTLVIRVPPLQEATIRVTDPLGRIVLKTRRGRINSHIAVPMSRYASGTYFVHVETGDRLKVSRFVFSR